MSKKKSEKTMCEYCEKREAQVFCVGDTTEGQKDRGKKLCSTCFDLNYLTEGIHNRR